MIGSKLLIELKIAKDKFTGRSIVQANNDCAGNKVGFTGDDRVAMTAIIAGCFRRNGDCGGVCVVGASAGQARCVQHMKCSTGQGCRRCSLSWLAVKLAVNWHGIRTGWGCQGGQKCKTFHQISSNYLLDKVRTILVWKVKDAIQNTAGRGSPSDAFADRGQARLQVAPMSSLSNLGRAGGVKAARPVFFGGPHG